MLRRAGHARINSSLIGESVMGKIAGLVPGPVDGRGPRDSVIGAASPLCCHLVTGRTGTAARRTVRQ